MAEYIDKEEILKMTNSYKNELGRLKADPFVKCGIETVEGFINEQPIADVRPVVKGKWITVKGGYTACNKCGAIGNSNYNGCPMCLADMREVE